MSPSARVRDGDPGREVVGAGMVAESAVGSSAEGRRSDQLVVRWNLGQAEMFGEHVADWMVGIFGLSDSRGSTVPCLTSR